VSHFKLFNPSTSSGLEVVCGLRSRRFAPGKDIQPLHKVGVVSTGMSLFPRLHLGLLLCLTPRLCSGLEVVWLS